MIATWRNPRRFDKNSWNYRVIQIRHALGWKVAKFARVSGVSLRTVMALELGETKRPTVDTIRRIKRVENEYADIIEAYKKAPVRMDRLRRQTKGRVRLLPIEVRRPEDIESLGKVEADSQPLFLGRGTRKRMQQIGMSLQWKEFITRNGKKSALSRAKNAAERRSRLQGDTEE